MTEINKIRRLLEDPKGIKTGWAGKWAELTWTCPSSLLVLSPRCCAGGLWPILDMPTFWQIYFSHYSLGKATDRLSWASDSNCTFDCCLSLNTQEQISIRSIPKTDCILKWTVKPPSPASSLLLKNRLLVSLSWTVAPCRWVLITCLLCSDALDTVAPFKTEC